MGRTRLQLCLAIGVLGLPLAAAAARAATITVTVNSLENNPITDEDPTAKVQIQVFSIVNRAQPAPIEVTVKGSAKVKGGTSSGPLPIDPALDDIIIPDQFREIQIVFTGTGTKNGATVALKSVVLSGVSNKAQTVLVTMPEEPPAAYPVLCCPDRAHHGVFHSLFHRRR